MTLDNTTLRVCTDHLPQAGCKLSPSHPSWFDRTDVWCRVQIMNSTLCRFFSPLCNFSSFWSRHCSRHLCIVYSVYQMFFPKSKRLKLVKTTGKILNHEEYFLMVLNSLLTLWETRYLCDRDRRYIRNLVKLLPRYTTSHSVRYFSYSPHKTSSLTHSYSLYNLPMLIVCLQKDMKDSKPQDIRYSLKIMCS
jgi:hypothetical protein